MHRRWSLDACVFGQAVEAHPDDANALGALGSFLFNVRQEREEAGTLLRSAVKLDPGHASNLGNLALFLSEGNQTEQKEAGFYHLRAVEEEPSNIRALGRLELALHHPVRGRHGAQVGLGTSPATEPR